MKRVIRRAILTSMTVDGSKPRTSAAIRTSNADASNPWMIRVPVTPATRFDQYVGKSLPIGMTAPRPVTTARRAGSISGKKDYLGIVGLPRLYEVSPTAFRRDGRQSPS